ncbi:DUF1853 family protein [Vibrio sp. SCSIO 43135]|uniref:DUF1853 family protein n=1 Tax=Vibrio sp. SCSIO 43135 TaxID=2819096 RepID=UPI002074D221|nr:DUF1853 family protein [Vibrio sp. SCSIO 43135]USD41892.1 DUF1853 family protein [Vibrio sp. SCSIO 43135]
MNSQQRFYHWIANTEPLFEITPPFESLQHLNTLLPQDLGYDGNPRLGFLYQHLCTQLLTSSNQYTLELEEIQINRDNGQTLGAIDLILNNQFTGQNEHWEVAIKFYLLHQGIWYGPNAHDQLDKKLNRMLNHQLKMSTNPHFLSQYPQFDNLSEHLLIQGRLYINPFSPEPVPTDCLGFRINKQQISGFWCYQSQWEQVNTPIYELSKPLWATGLAKYSNPIGKPNGRFVHAQAEDGQFWFIVPDSWPNN